MKERSELGDFLFFIGAGVIAVCTMLFVDSCAHQQSAPPPVVEAPAPPPPGSLTKFSPADESALLAAIAASPLATQHPKDGWEKGKCTQPQFWAALFSALAKYESSYNTNATYTEKFADQHGNRVVSRGLLQISVESANGSRYRCGVDEKTLHVGSVNLACGVKIAGYWLPLDGVVAGYKDTWLGMSRYWSPFRDAAKLQAMKSTVKAACL